MRHAGNRRALTSKIDTGGDVERVQREYGEIRALCTLCEKETQHGVVLTGRPRPLRHTPTHDLHRYHFCCECGSRQRVFGDLPEPPRPG